MADCKVNYSPTNYLTQEPVSIWNGQSSEQYTGNNTWSFATTGAPIPDGGTYTADKYQWLHSSYEKTITVGTAVLGIDDRTIDFNNVQYKFDLTAGTYKLIFEAIDPTGTWYSDRLTRYSSSSGYYGTPQYALHSSSGAVLNTVNFDRTKHQGQTFVHEEHEFTLATDRTIGLFFRGMGHADSTINGFMPRFMIVPTNTTTKKFDVTSNNVNYSGYSCWSGLYHSLRKLTTATEAVENPLYSDGTAITSYTIKGNTVQSGTPTPSAPISVQGVGNKTANLFDDTNIINIPNLGDRYGVELPSGTYSIYNDTGNNVYYGTNDWTGRQLACSPHSTATVQLNVGSGVGGFFIALNSASQGGCTIVEGSTPPDHYIPYGYKIPILNGGVTTNIYLGSVQSNRQIKKLVLTGNEYWNKSSGSNPDDYLYHLDISEANQGAISDSYCTHEPYTVQYPTGNTQGFTFKNYQTGFRLIYINVGADIMNAQPSGNTLNGFKEYLAAQYAAGTPVTVWYVLATAETGIVNEPLMKIGNYADTLSNATSIPTTDGANSITVDTTVQPSEFTATWAGWHDSSVKEYDGSDWQ